MGTKHQKLKNNLEENDEDLLEKYIKKKTENTEKTRRTEPEGNTRTFWVVIVVILLGLFFMNDVRNFSTSAISSTVSSVFSSEPSEGLLNRMNSLMIEMGYTDLTHDELRELRSEGVSATYISNVRALGFTDLTLDDAVRLANANVSSAFLAMMIELGYDDLDLDDFIQLRRAGVTAHYTSNVHDLGYTDVTPEQLIRMRRIGVSTSLIERLQEERGREISMDEIIRYRISNQ